MAASDASVPSNRITASAGGLAFASNSLLCRAALQHGAIDPVTFTSIRLCAGAAMLFALGLFTVLTRRNAVAILMGVELILNAAALNFVAFATYVHGLVADEGDPGRYFVDCVKA